MDEDPVDRHGRRLAAREVAHAHRLHSLVAENLLDDRPLPDLDVRARADPAPIRLLAAQVLVRVDEHDPDVVRRQLERLQEGGVAAADHCDGLAAEQRPVARGAVAQPLAHEVVLARHP